MARIQLPNGCSCTPFSVYPKNWESQNPSLDVLWQIRYRFYDPRHASRYRYGKQVRITGINGAGTANERRKEVRSLIKNERDKLENFSFNPITQTTSDPEDVTDYIIHPNTPIIPAMEKACARLLCAEDTRKHVARSIGYISRSVISLAMQFLPIGKVQKRHVKMILDKIPEIPGLMKKGKGSGPKGPWTSSSFNHYRSYLIMVFNELRDVEATELDPVSGIKKMKGVKRIRETLTKDQRKIMREYLAENHYPFYRFTEAFFHSGARMSELVRVKREDVDLARQKYLLVIRKGVNFKQVEKTIKNIALPVWIEILNIAKPGQYLFSRNLMPGDKQISARQITKRWRIHVKQKLGITADFYSLKHSHSTEIVSLLGTKQAADHNSHVNEAMVVNIYDVERAEREHQTVRTLENPL